jgi:hypothetical protein
MKKILKEDWIISTNERKKVSKSIILLTSFIVQHQNPDTRGHFLTPPTQKTCPMSIAKVLVLSKRFFLAFNFIKLAKFLFLSV